MIFIFMIVDRVWTQYHAKLRLRHDFYFWIVDLAWARHHAKLRLRHDFYCLIMDHAWAQHHAKLRLIHNFYFSDSGLSKSSTPCQFIYYEGRKRVLKV